jgi:hypothetical protein
MALLDDLDAFAQEHRRCGELSSAVEPSGEQIEVVWMACTCGGTIVKRLEPGKPDPKPTGGER